MRQQARKMRDEDGAAERITAGIDVGTSAVKVAVMRDRGPLGAEMLAGCAERIRRRKPDDVAEGVLDSCLVSAGLARADLHYVATTGEGENLACRTGHFYGMTTHARGALFLEPAARAALDVGALHTRAIVMNDQARVLGYRMTSQCASGSGQFLENISRYLGVTLEEIGPISCESHTPEPCSSICAVLAETDVINMVSRGIATADILKGIHLSMAGRYLKLLSSAGTRGIVLVTGGLAEDTGLMAALSELAANEDEKSRAAAFRPGSAIPCAASGTTASLGADADADADADAGAGAGAAGADAASAGSAMEIRAHEHSVLAGAIGAALWGAFRSRRLAARGLSLEPGAHA